MTGRASALAVLGLDPGADAAAVEQAYKRLIKQHHPDREGGDASRAAEITKAYREARGGKATSDPLQFNDDLWPQRGRRRWRIAATFAAAGVAAAVLVVGPSVPLTRTLWAAGAQLPTRHAATAAMPQPMNDRLHVNAIDAEVRTALQMFRTRDESALADASADCQRRFRDDPGTAMLDRCAAFDDAVVGLEDRDPIRDEGPFAPLAVTGRQWSAASSLSDDDIAIDERLDQIRLRVELSLAPPAPPPATANGD
ncbi:MAG TPA: J domain-containing protein [Stellaceae bacterium]|nr:J domain-containing protein [Stellaceae bacterium]